MKITTLATCLIFVFGWATELLAQFVPVVAKQRSIDYLIQPDGTETEVLRQEGTYFRSSSGSVLDTMEPVKGENRGTHRSTLMDSSTRKTYDLEPQSQRSNTNASPARTVPAIYVTTRSCS